MDLNRAHAEWTLERFPSQRLPELGARMMMLGFDSPAILELACFHRPAPGDVPSALIERAFADCGLPPLTREDAKPLWIAALVRANVPAREVLEAVASLELCPDCDGPLAELVRLAEDWRGSKTSLMRMGLEDHVLAAGRRLLNYVEDR